MMSEMGTSDPLTTEMKKLGQRVQTHRQSLRFNFKERRGSTETEISCSPNKGKTSLLPVMVE